jgi:hypothetical protein
MLEHVELTHPAAQSMGAPSGDEPGSVPDHVNVTEAGDPFAGLTVYRSLLVVINSVLAMF